MTTIERCTTCNNEGEAGTDWHPYRHPLTLAQGAGSAPLNAPQTNNDRSDRDSVPVESARFPFDPVLRQALLTAGVITAQDLTDAENHIKAVSGMVMDMMGGSDDAGDRPGSATA